MGRISKLLRDQRPLLESLYGNIDNLIVENNSEKALRFIENADKKDKEYSKWKNINNSISSVNITDDDLYNVEKSVNYDDPLIKNTDAWKKYDEYKNSILDEFNKSKTTGDNTTAGETTPVSEPSIMSFQDYLNTDPAMLNDITSKFQVEKKTAKEIDELKKDIYKKANLSEEDINFYSQYKPPFVEEYNKSLYDIVYQNYPKLQSRGSLGNTLAENFSGRLLNKLLKDSEPVKKKVDFHDGYKWIFDEYGNELSREKIEKNEDKKFNLSGDAQIIAIPDENGNLRYGFFEPDPNANDYGNQGWKFTGIVPTQDQIDEFTETGKYEKKKTGGTGRGGRRGSGPKSEDTGQSQFEKDSVAKLKEFARLKSESASSGWDKFSKDVDQYGLEKESAEAKKYFELEKDLQSRFPGMDVHSLANDIYKEDFKKGKNKKTEAQYLEERVAEEEEYNTANQNVEDFWKSVTDAWGRSDLTAEQWADEILQEDWSDMERKVLKNKYRSLFGKEINL